jgi:hypothetical protein
MDAPATKRGGPLLWIGDLARRRPALAILLALLLAVLALLSVGGTTLVWRQQRVRQMRLRAQEQWRQAQEQQGRSSPAKADTRSAP